ncbi:CapA family protein [Glutamicibacter endophyticus]|uniref:CapA family protein n=1 Tax=Glutamicibacter endophyticus TaxID=1522174 RepID=UPI003AEF3393
MNRRRAALVALTLLLSSCAAPETSAPAPGDSAPSPSASSQAPQLTETAQPSSGASTTASESASAPPDTFSLMVTGDVLLHPTLVRQAETSKGHDFHPLLAGLEPFVKDADVALCNMETPIGDAPYSGYPRFKGPAQIAEDLADLGYDGCTTATNHTMDGGASGAQETLDALESAGLFTTGSYRTQAESKLPPIIERQGVKLAVIAGTYSLNGLPEDKPWRVDDQIDAKTLIGRAQKARKVGADLVVAAVHDGAEYTDRPTSSQRKLGRELAASGAFDFVYMHHTHSAQPIEKYKGTWIVYGLGNSVAKHATVNQLNREGISVKATFSRSDAGRWSVDSMAWVPHWLTGSPIRWCALPASDAKDAAAGDCPENAEAQASRERSTRTVDAYGALEDGLRDWVPKK